ncbi:hypothetical protein CROQUDRAFT_653721 [Cronartium quercuum f. sp. fusiforme G11]|uniref:Ribosomal RNA-processing protein 43 n=1 Tax=Cronartium quercuum f. sp. fusiforme G11 TaxID=708437 RepID=A0A9P6NNS4_9BASI|nr:hypothetical protein CROQUDRAFT_653721 [Cronartium quercuum f. sp. fusiforme G11]
MKPQSAFAKLNQKQSTQNAPISSVSNAPTPSLREFEPDVFQRLQPKAYLEHHLKQSTRPDGRPLDGLRDLRIDNGSISSAHGSSLVTIGKTSVVCGIRFEVAEPDHMTPNQGFVVPNVEIGPLCASKFKPGPPSEESQVISSRIRDIITSAGLVSLTSLVIHPGKLVWVIYIDVIGLSHDGNVFDASLLSITHALKNARRPIVQYDPDLNQVLLPDPACSELLSLDIPHSIFPLSFAVFNRSHILPDPTLFEEEQSQGTITVVLDSSKALRHLSYSGVIEPQTAGKQSTLEYCIEFTVKQMQSQSRSSE